MQSYRDLEVYQLAHKLAVEIHAMSLKLPQFEMFEEGSQIRRSSKAIAANEEKLTNFSRLLKREACSLEREAIELLKGGLKCSRRQ